MQISNEIIFSAFSAILVGVTLKFSEWFMNRKNQEDQQKEDRIKSFHDSVEDELQALREENRKLREESDKYRLLYHELLQQLSLRYPDSWNK